MKLRTLEMRKDPVFASAALLLSLVITAPCCWAAKSSGSSKDETNKNYEDLFNVGKDSYLANDWANCVKYFNLALDDYHYYKEAVNNCKMQCRKEVSDFTPLQPKDLDDFHFYEKVTRNTLCLMKCKRTALGKDRVELITKTVAESFDNKGPYNYLQLCYYQVE